MLRIRPIAYYAIAGCLGAFSGTALAHKLPTFWAWLIAGMIISLVILVSNTTLRRRWLIGGLGVLAVGLASGGAATLISRL